MKFNFNFNFSPTTETNIKSALVLAGVMTLIGTVGSFVAGTTGVLFSLGFTFAISAAVMWFSRELALWLMDAKEVKAGEKPEGFDLNEIIENLRKLEPVSLEVMPKVCIIESETKNAFATGRHKGHTAIAITTGLLKTAKEHAKGDMAQATKWVEAILLHELGHIVNYDIATKTAASILVGGVRVLSESLYRQRRENEARRGNNNNRASIWRTVGEYFVFYFAIPMAGNLLGLCLSRTREFAADDMAAKCGRAKDMAEAFELLRKPCHKEGHVHSAQMEAFSSMMCASLNPDADQKLAERSKAPDVGTFESICISVSKAFSTHPALDDRIARMRTAEQNAANDSTSASKKVPSKKRA
jgi:heat shock protein HtpX